MFVASFEGAYIVATVDFDGDVPNAPIGQPVKVSVVPNAIIVTTFAHDSWIDVDLSVGRRPLDTGGPGDWETVVEDIAFFQGDVAVTNLEFEPAAPASTLELTPGHYHVQVLARSRGFVETLGTSSGDESTEEHLVHLWRSDDDR